MIALSGALGYLLGSLAPAFWLGRLLKGIDVRERGYRNSGTRNAKHLLGLWPAVATAVIDTGKGVAAVVVAELLLGVTGPWLVVPAAGAVLGHIFPFHLRFRGGKGVAAAAAVSLYGVAREIIAGSFDPLSILVILIAALIMYLATRNADPVSLLAFPSLFLAVLLERGVQGYGLLIMACTAFMFAMMTLLIVRRRVFRVENAPESYGGWRTVVRPAALLFIPLDGALPHWAFLTLLGTVLAVFIGLEVARGAGLIQGRRIYRFGERRRVSSILWFLMAIALSYVLYDRAIWALTVAFLTIGDLAGKTIGVRFGRREVLVGRTLEGSMAYFAAALCAGCMVGIAFDLAWYLPVIGAGLAALTELASGPADDNLTVGLVPGAALTLGLRLFG
jgi:glycerol-3-phosphate acyltransferase PlsY